MFRGRIGTIGLKQVENQMKPNKCEFFTLHKMLYFCTGNERNLFFFENRPVGFHGMPINLASFYGDICTALPLSCVRCSETYYC